MQFKMFALEQLVDQAESTHGVSLSTAARQALIAPVLEAQSFGSSVSDKQVELSIDAIVKEAAGRNDPLTGNTKQISSVGITNAIHRKFCSIPPFCAP